MYVPVSYTHLDVYKRQTLTHPFLQEQTTVGMLVHLQALLFARWIRGDLDAYPPFLWKA